MVQLLGLVVISFFVSALLLVPFVDFLFAIRRKYVNKADHPEEVDAPKIVAVSDTPIHDKLMKADFNTPVGGGILIIAVIVLLSVGTIIFKGDLFNPRLGVLLLSLLSFGALGLVDDVKHLVYRSEGKFKGLPSRIIFPVQIALATVIALILYFSLGFNNIYVPILGNVMLGWWYIPLAIFAIVGFSNAYNISDGLDGLSSGLLTICLVAFLVLAHTVFDTTLSVFVGIWIGALIAYLYFNVYPARIHLGDAGGFAFGATLAVVGLLTGKIFGLAIIGGMYVVIILSSVIQIFSKRVFKRKVFPVAPIHMYFKYIGWPEPKIVNRFWLAGAMCAVMGLWLSLLSK